MARRCGRPSSGYFISNAVTHVHLGYKGVGDIQSRQGVWHLRIEDKREKIRYIPLALVAQRLITAYLDTAKHGDKTDGPLLRPVKNNATGTLAKPLHKSSVWDMVRLYT